MASPYLKSVDATWTTPFSSELWSKVENLKATASAQGDFFTLGPTLPDGEERRVAEVLVHRNEPQNELRWALSARPAPSVDPPEHIKVHDEKLRGRRGLSLLLAEAFLPGAPVVGSFHLRLHFLEAQFTCPLIPAVITKGEGHDAALLLGRGARLEEVGYRFEGGGAGGIEQVTLLYDHVEQRYAALVSATGPLKLGSSTWLPFAEDLSELVQNTFFSPKEAQA